MKKFIDTKPTYVANENLSAESVYIDGIPLEDQIDGFTTLNVSGRELVPYKNLTNEVSGADGTMWLSANYGERTIKVKYLLKARSDTEFRQKFELLNFYLSKKQAIFKFYDDPLYFWVGTVTAIEDFPVAVNSGISSFTITCNSPFKRRIEAVTFDNKQDGKLRISEPAYWATLPDEIKIVLKARSGNIRLVSPRNLISLTGNFSAGDTVILKPSDSPDSNSEIMLNGIEKFELLDLTSDFENFTLKYKDEVSCNVDADIYIRLRSKHL